MRMQIKPILAAAVAAAFMASASAAFAADEAPEMKTETKAEVKSEDVVEGKTEEQPLQKARKVDTTVSVRSTRPQNEPHKDARACLDAGNNEAVIKCAEKYR
jgi:hypothetical protein